MYCETVARQFVGRGRHVVYLTSAVDGRPAIEARDGYTIVRRGSRFTVYLAALVWLLRHRRQIDGVIDSQNGIPFFTPLAVSRDTPIVLLLHHIHQDQFAEYFPPQVAAIGRWLERTGTRVVYGDRAIAAVSPSTRQGARRRLGLRGAIWVVPPGCDAVSASSIHHGGRVATERIVCVGRQVPHKRTDRIVAAMPGLLALFPDLELHLIGDGPLLPELRRQVDSLGIGGSVQIHGSLPAERRDELLCGAWLTVNASQGEGWGLSVVEANAVGIPALAYRCPGLRDSIRHGVTGWLIDEDEELEEAIAKALVTLSDEERAAEIAERARRWVSRFTWEESVSQLAAALESERGRLQHDDDDRRVRTDLAMVVSIPNECRPPGWDPTFRVTDLTIETTHGLVVLLRGADSVTARVALLRAGLTRSVMDDPRVQISVARPTDLLSPELGVADLEPEPAESTTGVLTG